MINVQKVYFHKYENKVGDVLLYKPKSKGLMRFFEETVCLVTESPYCHVAIMLSDDDKHKTAQAFPKGFVVNEEYGYFTHCFNKGWVDVYRTKIPLQDSQKTALLNVCEEFKGLPYDWLDILNIAIYRFTGKRISLGNAKNLICSEAVSIAFNQAGIDLCPEKDDDLTSPADIANSQVLYKVSFS